MTERFIEFLIDSSGSLPKNLKDSIRKVQNASAGFINSWNEKNLSDATETSQEAFEHLDFIQNELLRQRDKQKLAAKTWSDSPYRTALGNPVGRICIDFSKDESDTFLALQPHLGALPSNKIAKPLSLERALNKLKHHMPSSIKFSINPPNEHILYLFTQGGMGQPDSIVEINIKELCAACKVAADLL